MIPLRLQDELDGSNKAKELKDAIDQSQDHTFYISSQQVKIISYKNDKVEGKTLTGKTFLFPDWLVYNVICS